MNTEEILELIDKMITEWESVKTWEGICKRDALKELKFEIQSRLSTFHRPLVFVKGADEYETF